MLLRIVLKWGLMIIMPGRLDSIGMQPPLYCLSTLFLPLLSLFLCLFRLSLFHIKLFLLTLAAVIGVVAVLAVATGVDAVAAAAIVNQGWIWREKPERFS